MKPNPDTNKLPKTVDEYLAEVPEEDRAALMDLRAAIRAAAPKAEEIISYRIPTYRFRGSLVHFAAFRDHCSFIVVNKSILDLFADELKSFPHAGATIRFTAQHPLPAELVRKIVRKRMEQNLDLG